MTRSLHMALLAGCMGAVLAGPAAAQDFPSKPITLLVGFGAGGMTDVSARMLAQELGEELGQNIIVENRPGGTGVLALNDMLKADHDGYTIAAFVSDSVFLSTYQERPVDLATFGMLGGYLAQERVLFAAENAPFSTLEEFVAYAKENPVTFADGASFSSSRVMEAFAKKNGMELRMAPFKSGAEASAAIMGGHVMTAETGVGTPAWFEARSSGTLKILATLSPGGLGALGMPEVGTLSAAGSEFAVETTYGLAAPSDVPPAELAVLREAFAKVLADPSVQEQFAKVDLPVSYLSPEEFTAAAAGTAHAANGLREYLAK